MTASEVEPVCPGLAAVADTDGRLISDVPCVRCGYSLRRQPRDGLCPECATPVMAALRADLLRFSDTGWLRRVTGGLILCAVNAGLTLVVLIVLRAVSYSNLIAPQVSMLFWESVWVLTGLLGLVAVWRTTTPDPGCEDLPTDLNVRTLARLAAFSVVAALLLHMCMWFGPTLGLLVDSHAYSVAAAAIALTFATQMFCLFTHIGRLAQRTPRGSRPRLHRALAVGFVAFAAGAYLASLVDRLPYRGFATYFSYAVGTLAQVIGPFCLLASVPTFVWAARAIRGEARVAERLRH